MQPQLCVLSSQPQPHLMRPIQNRTEIFNAPDGGLWTSTWVDGTSDWMQWVRDSAHRGEFRRRQWWLLSPNAGARILTIDSQPDLQRLTELYGIWPDYWAARRAHVDQGPHDATWRSIMSIDTRTLDFEAIQAAGYDGIHLTKEGLLDMALHSRREVVPTLGYWDCESTIWFRWCFDDVQQVRRRKP